MRRLSVSRRDALQKMALREIRKPPVQVVSPEKLLPCAYGDKRYSTATDNKNSISTSPIKVSFYFSNILFNFMINSEMISYFTVYLFITYIHSI